MSTYPPPPPEECPYCGSNVQYYVSSLPIYGTDYGPMWVCGAYPHCDTYIGTHEDRLYDEGRHVGRHKPLGTLANVEARRWRKAAHEALDPLWKTTDLTRSQAYAVVADFLECPIEEAHIGMMTKENCKNMIWALMKHGPSLS